MKFRSNIFSLVLIFIIHITVCEYLFADTQIDTHFDSDNSLAVLPIFNLSGRSKASKVVTQKLTDELIIQHVKFQKPSEIRPILRKYRIRSSGSLKIDDIKQIKSELQASYILLCTVNIYEDRYNPEFSISLRLLNTDNYTITSAVTRSAAGRDFEGLFGLGVISTIEELMDRVVSEAIKELFRIQQRNLTKSNALSAAFIPFENITDYNNAGYMLTNIFLTEMTRLGYNILEPGIINEYMLQSQNVLRGGIDLPTLDIITSKHDVNLIITGSIEEYKQSRGMNFPSVEIGTRVLDATSGKIIFMYNNKVNGSDSESLFGIGKKYSIGTVMKKYIIDFEKNFKKRSEKYFAKKD